MNRVIIPYTTLHARTPIGPHTCVDAVQEGLHVRLVQVDALGSRVEGGVISLVGKFRRLLPGAPLRSGSEARGSGTCVLLM